MPIRIAVSGDAWPRITRYTHLLGKEKAVNHLAVYQIKQKDPNRIFFLFLKVH